MLEMHSGISGEDACGVLVTSESVCTAIGGRTSFAQAQEETLDSGEELAQPEAVELEDMLVSVERITPVSGASVALVTAEQIRESQAKDVAEALKGRVPGVTGKRSGGINLDPVIRGLREDRLSVMTNGTKIWGGGPFRMDPPTSLLDVDELEAIEVIKGPYSVTRGPSSIGGTINLVTKKPELSSALGRAWFGWSGLHQQLQRVYYQGINQCRWAGLGVSAGRQLPRLSGL